MSLKITNIFADNEIVDNEKIIDDSSLLYVERDALVLGDQLTLTYSEAVSGHQEATYLSVDHYELYRDLALEAEIEFNRRDGDIPQNFELIVRGVNRWNKNFTIDEYYAFGIQDAYFYLAKVSYHEEGDNSYAYKRLLNLNKDKDGIVQHFIPLTDEIKDALFLGDDDTRFKYDNKYKFRCEIKGDSASFKIKNTSKVESFETDYGWVSVYDDVDIDQIESEVSNRDADLVRIVGVVEPLVKISDKGMFGFSVPNSFVKVYRFEAVPLEKDLEPILYNAEEYSREVSSDFSHKLRSTKQLKLNSSNSIDEIKTSFKEFENVTDNYVMVDSYVADIDIEKIQLNNISQKSGIHFKDKFVDVQHPMTQVHEGSVIKGYVDPDIEKNRIGQLDEYFKAEQKADGSTRQFGFDSALTERYEMYPNYKLGDVMVQVDPDLLYNTFNEVGVKANPNKFIDNDKLQELYNGRKFYMETNFRGSRRFFEMGALGNGRFTFKIDEFFSNGSDSFDAVWKYELAEFIDNLNSSYNVISISGAYDDVITNPVLDFNLTRKLSNALNPTDDTVGYMIATHSPDDIEVIANKTSVTPEFKEYAVDLDVDIKRLLKGGFDIAHLRALLDYFQLLNYN